MRTSLPLSESAARGKIAFQPLHIVAVAHNKRDVMLVFGQRRAHSRLFERSALRKITVIARPIGRHGVIAVIGNIFNKRYFVVVPTVYGDISVQKFQYVPAKRPARIRFVGVYARPSVLYAEIAQGQVEIAPLDDLMYKRGFIEPVFNRVKHDALSLVGRSPHLGEIAYRLNPCRLRPRNKLPRHAYNIVSGGNRRRHVYGHVVAIEVENRAALELRRTLPDKPPQPDALVTLRHILYIFVNIYVNLFVLSVEYPLHGLREREFRVCQLACR